MLQRQYRLVFHTGCVCRVVAVIRTQVPDYCRYIFVVILTTEVKTQKVIKMFYCTYRTCLQVPFIRTSRKHVTVVRRGR